MHARILPCLCALLLACQVTQVRAQQQTNAPVPPPTATFSSFADSRQQEEDDDALDKQLDEFHKRLQALEAGAQQSADDQSAGTYAERIANLEDEFKSTSEAMSSTPTCAWRLMNPGQMNHSGRSWTTSAWPW